VSAKRRSSLFSFSAKAAGRVSPRPCAAPISGRRRAIAVAVAAFGAALLALDPPAPAAAAGSFLYATPHACASSGIFRRRECEIAFANAQTELQERTESFSSRGRCEARYRLCEKRDGDETVYRPVLLGVEIIGGRDHWSVAPLLGVETPRLFSGRPISRLVAPRPMTERWTPILAGGRFRLGKAGAETASAEPFDEADFEMQAKEPEPAAYATRESPDARRERLRSAPFVQ
jgi:hypothetical protein